MTPTSILVSWRPPTQPNGIITQYTVYYKSIEDKGPNSLPNFQKIPPKQTNFEALDLDSNIQYEFWVTAATNIGEGQPSKSVFLSPNEKVPAKIASFDGKFVATYREDVKLPCLAVGVPKPQILWKSNGVPFVQNERMRQLPEGSLFIKEVKRTDAGEYSCSVENSFGHDSVIHQLIVNGNFFVKILTVILKNMNIIFFF